MILRLDEVGALLRGSLGYSKKEGNRIAFSRFTEHQMALYDRNRAFFGAVRAAMWENILIFIMTAV